MADSLNRGGSHGGEDLEPPFAWSEGASTGCGCLLRAGRRRYIDSMGTIARRCRCSAERRELDAPDVRGIGGEETVDRDRLGPRATARPASPTPTATWPRWRSAPLYAAVPGLRRQPGGALHRHAARPRRRRRRRQRRSIATLMTPPRTSRSPTRSRARTSGPSRSPCPACAERHVRLRPRATTRAGSTSASGTPSTSPRPATRTFTLTIGPTRRQRRQPGPHLETFTGALLGQSAPRAARRPEMIGPSCSRPATTSCASRRNAPAATRPTSR